MDGRRSSRSSSIAYESKAEVRYALIELIIFIFFLIATTYIAFSSKQKYIFYFDNALDRLFTHRNSREFERDFAFEDIVTIDEWWTFLEGTFLDDFHESLRISDDGVEFLDTNLVIESPRLRQIRVKPKKCPKHEVFNKYFDECYDEYTIASESKEEFYKGSKFVNLTFSHMRPVWAVVERYQGGGYIEWLKASKEENREIIRKLRANKWVDRGTRLLIMEFVIYNANLDMFCKVQLLAEILPTGGVVPSSSLQTVPLYTTWSLTRRDLFVAVLIFYAIIAFNTAFEICEFWSTNFKHYLGSVWNYIDWSILLCGYTALTFSLLHSYAVDEYIMRRYLQDVTLMSLDELCSWFLVYTTAMGACTFLAWIRIFRFVNFNQTMLHFNLAIRQSAGEIFGFAAVLLIAFGIFAILGLMLFGTSNVDFSSFSRAYFFMLRLMLHDFDYEYFQRAEPVLGSIFFMVYIIVVFFILLNVFLAIINRTYMIVKESSRSNRSILKSLILQAMKKLGACCHQFRLKSQPTEDKTDRVPSDTESPESRPPSASSKVVQYEGNLPSTSGSKFIPEDELPSKTKFSENEDENAKRGNFIPEEELPPRALSQEEAIKEYFGDVSPQDQQIDQNEEPSAMPSKSSQNVSSFTSGQSSEDEITRLFERVVNLESLIDVIKADMAQISSIIDTTNKRTS